jgi:hypothetical protein
MHSSWNGGAQLSPGGTTSYLMPHSAQLRQQRMQQRQEIEDLQIEDSGDDAGAWSVFSPGSEPAGRPRNANPSSRPGGGSMRFSTLGKAGSPEAVRRAFL